MAKSMCISAALCAVFLAGSGVAALNAEELDSPVEARTASSMDAYFSLGGRRETITFPEGETTPSSSGVNLNNVRVVIEGEVPWCMRGAMGPGDVLIEQKGYEEQRVVVLERRVRLNIQRILDRMDRLAAQALQHEMAPEEQAQIERAEIEDVMNLLRAGLANVAASTEFAGL